MVVNYDQNNYQIRFWQMVQVR